jgi:tryptophan synthase alpha chain
VSRLTQVFTEAGRPLLMPYAVGGYPDLEGCARILDAYQSAGADLIEVGIPFSDPLADGPMIQTASSAALRRGVRPDDVLDLVAGTAAAGGRPVLLSYLNTVLAFGPERFFARCSEAGVLGVVIPDLPVEEAAQYQEAAGAASVDLVLLVAPTSSDARLQQIAAAAAGFIYCVSTTGVTGARATVDAGLPGFLARVRRYTELPLAVGFGISTPEQAADVAGYADGVILGSTLVDKVAAAADLEAGLSEVTAFLSAVREGMEHD